LLRGRNRSRVRSGRLLRLHLFPWRFQGQEKMPVATTKKRSLLNQILDRVPLLLAGLQKALPAALNQITLKGVTYTPQQLQQELQAFLDLCSAVQTNRAELDLSIAQRDAQVPRLRALVLSLDATLHHALGQDAQTLDQFGLAPKVKVKASPEAFQAGQKKRAMRAQIRAENRKELLAKLAALDQEDTQGGQGK
jgi:hypothetical protein